jgi:energy-coupling factor transporter ATP-binding protein EcfA2
MFKKAVRSQAKLKLAITGPSGSGKTYSALRLATGLGAKIAVLDTENGSASLYSDKFEFDVVSIDPPFSVERYQDAIDAAEKAGYDVLILDSITHAWSGEGGLLEEKEKLDSRNRNSFGNWAHITKKHEAFKSAILHTPIHVIATMRSKQDYAQVEENGRKVVKKLGLAPQQRDGMEYEFTVVFDVAMNHEAEASKDRTSLFTGKIFQVTEKTGQQLAEWLSSAPAPAPAKPSVASTPEVTGVTAAPRVNDTREVSPPASEIKVEFFGIEPGAPPGEYKLAFGKDKGKMIKDLGPDVIRQRMDYFLDIRAKGGQLSGTIPQFMNYAEKYLNELPAQEFAPMREDEVPF